ncbi:hypothetical protein DFH06DRAFT_443772 [Mycena polygramma]|nr:hypothetical protein DFH06DRAFT_443772 [Mycena polygramma]
MRIHKAGVAAARSSVFRDMVAFAQPDTPNDFGSEKVDGCTVVVLHDSARDVEAFLRAIVDSSYFMPPPDAALFWRQSRPPTRFQRSGCCPSVIITRAASKWRGQRRLKRKNAFSDAYKRGWSARTCRCSQHSIFSTLATPLGRVCCRENLRKLGWLAPAHLGSVPIGAHGATWNV